MTDKNKDDTGKAPISLVPTRIVWEIAKVRAYGLKKYPETGRDGWRETGTERIRDAMLRHILRDLADPFGTDPESGQLHLSHAACNIAFLLEMMDP